jgi:hypothetical protein
MPDGGAGDEDEDASGESDRGDQPAAGARKVDRPHAMNKATEAQFGGAGAFNLATAPLHAQAQYYGPYNQGPLLIPQPPPYPQALNHQLYQPYPHGQPQPHQTAAAPFTTDAEDDVEFPSVRDWLEYLDGHPKRMRKGHLYSQYAGSFETNAFDTINQIPLDRKLWTPAELTQMLGIPGGILASILTYLEKDIPAVKARTLSIPRREMEINFQGPEINHDFNFNAPHQDYQY